MIIMNALAFALISANLACSVPMEHLNDEQITWKSPELLKLSDSLDAERNFDQFVMFMKE